MKYRLWNSMVWLCFCKIYLFEFLIQNKRLNKLKETEITVVGFPIGRVRSIFSFIFIYPLFLNFPQWVLFPRKNGKNTTNYPSAAFFPPLLILHPIPSEKPTWNYPTNHQKQNTNTNIYHNRNIIQYYFLIFPTQFRVLIFITYSS